MPTWDGEKSLNAANVEIIYASPYYFNGNEKLLKQLSAAYKLKYLGRPSDQFFKGYETLLYFTNALLSVPMPVFNSIKLMPVYNTSIKNQIDYQENKNLYLSSRNLQGVKTVTVSELNTYDLMRASKVFITDSVIGKIEEILK